MFSNLRIGHGYDVHRLVEGRRCIIGGVDIPYERGLLGHSDADVLAHALADAILGACRGNWQLLRRRHEILDFKDGAILHGDCLSFRNDGGECGWTIPVFFLPDMPYFS